MTDPEDRIGCVVLTIKGGRETVVLDTTDGEIRVEVSPQGGNKVRVVLRAPRRIPIRREKNLPIPAEVA